MVLFLAVWRYSDTNKLLQVNNSMMQEILESNKKILKIWKEQKENALEVLDECARTRIYKNYNFRKNKDKNGQTLIDISD